MISRLVSILFLLTTIWTYGATTQHLWAQTSTQTPEVQTNDEGVTEEGFAKPYEYERQAYGYDPEGIEYKENQPEDFQVIFISAAPFAAAASYGLTGLASQLFRNSFSIDGDYLIPFLVGTVAGATTVACISVLDNKYPAPPPVSSNFQAPSLPPLAFNMTVLSTTF
jgi:hypothetical protein